MRNGVLSGVTGLVLLAALARCSSSNGTDASSAGTLVQSSLTRDAAASIPQASVDAAVAANNAFAADLYGRLRATNATANFVTSPLSASLALTMAYAGAAGQTQTQMATALHITDPSTLFDGQNGLDQALIGRAASALASARANAPPGTALPSADDYQMEVVNAMWADKTVSLKAPFLDTLAKSYGAGVREVNFIGDPADALTAINDWVADQTSGKIEDLLDATSVTSDTRLVLADALHLKFPWASSFDVKSTAPQTFTRSDGTTVQTLFMVQGYEGATYADDGLAQVVELPLAGNQLAVEIALPHGDLATWEAGLTAGSVPFTRPQGFASVTLSLPKISFTTQTFSLSDALKAMGMVDAFSDGADFSGLSSSPLKISAVEQKAMVSMEENGVEAAAATAVVFADAGAALGGSFVTMTVNKPYLLSILDTTTGAVLFVGHITDPTNTGAQ